MRPGPAGAPDHDPHHPRQRHGLPPGARHRRESPAPAGLAKPRGPSRRLLYGPVLEGGEGAGKDFLRLYLAASLLSDWQGCSTTSTPSHTVAGLTTSTVHGLSVSRHQRSQSLPPAMVHRWEGSCWGGEQRGGDRGNYSAGRRHIFQKVNRS